MHLILLDSGCMFDSSIASGELFVFPLPLCEGFGKFDCIAWFFWLLELWKLSYFRIFEDSGNYWWHGMILQLVNIYVFKFKSFIRELIFFSLLFVNLTSILYGRYLLVIKNHVTENWWPVGEYTDLPLFHHAVEIHATKES